jgi:hypothetical protein
MDVSGPDASTSASSFSSAAQMDSRARTVVPKCSRMRMLYSSVCLRCCSWKTVPQYTLTREARANAPHRALSLGRTPPRIGES